MMALRLACEMSDRFVAIAAFNAQFSEEQAADCHPRRPLSLLLMNGTADDRIPFAGGVVKLATGEELGRVLSTDETARWWRAHNRCRPHASRASLTGLHPADGSAITSNAWRCARGTQVVVYEVEGGGHRLPGVNRSAGREAGATPPLRGIDLIWAFVKRHF
jgi:polyhydroxybutyrate depolymerase